MICGAKVVYCNRIEGCRIRLKLPQVDLIERRGFLRPAIEQKP